MSDIPDNTDAILGGQNPPPIDAAVLGGVAGTKQMLAHQFGAIHELDTFETVTVNKGGEIVSRIKKQAFYYTENLGDGIMHGNVWEWCEDCWHENYQSAPVDGSAWSNDCWHETYQESFQWNDRRVYVVRGGGCHDIPNNCKSAFRNGLVASTP